MAANGFSRTRTIEREYARTLRRVAAAVGNIVAMYSVNGVITNIGGMRRALAQYSEQLGPWAEKLTEGIISRVASTNARAWGEGSGAIGKELRALINTTPTGAVARAIQMEQVELIKSLPIEAGERAQRLAMESQQGGIRASEAAEEIMRTEHVTKSRATLIARTEIAKANASMTEARAEYIGATHYIWRTAEDEIVREQHRALNGKVFAFADPPEIEGEGRHGPGQIWNCRCYAEPIFDLS